MKVELPSFNGNVSIEEYLDWVSEMEKFFDYIGTADDKQVCLVENEKINGRSVLTTKLPAGVVQTIQGLQARYSNS